VSLQKLPPSIQGQRICGQQHPTTPSGMSATGASLAWCILRTKFLCLVPVPNWFLAELIVLLEVTPASCCLGWTVCPANCLLLMSQALTTANQTNSCVYHPAAVVT
jgi:hypothetical protein